MMSWATKTDWEAQMPPNFNARISFKAKHCSKPSLAHSEQGVIAMNYEVKNGKLTIVVDVSEDAIKSAQPSKSGKSKLIASTNGFVAVSPKVRLSLNLISS